MNPTKIGKFISRKRVEMGYTQKELAEKLQLEGHAFSDLRILRIQQGNLFVPNYEIITLADFFGITTDELLKEKAKNRYKKKSTNLQNAMNVDFFVYHHAGCVFAQVHIAKPSCRDGSLLSKIYFNITKCL